MFQKSHFLSPRDFLSFRALKRSETQRNGSKTCFEYIWCALALKRISTRPRRPKMGWCASIVRGHGSRPWSTPSLPFIVEVHGWRPLLAIMFRGYAVRPHCAYMVWTHTCVSHYPNCAQVVSAPVWLPSPGRTVTVPHRDTATLQRCNTAIPNTATS